MLVKHSKKTQLQCITGMKSILASFDNPLSDTFLLLLDGCLVSSSLIKSFFFLSTFYSFSYFWTYGNLVSHVWFYALLVGLLKVSMRHWCLLRPQTSRTTQIFPQSRITLAIRPEGERKKRQRQTCLMFFFFLFVSIYKVQTKKVIKVSGLSKVRDHKDVQSRTDEMVDKLPFLDQ